MKLENIQKKRIINFKDIADEEKDKIFKTQFEAAITYDRKKKEGMTRSEWISKQIKDSGLDMTWYRLDDKGGFEFSNAMYGVESEEDESKGLIQQIERWAEEEQGEEKNKLIEMRQLLKTVLLLWEEEKIKPVIQYYGKDKKAVLGLTEQINNTDYKTNEEIKRRLQMMEQLSLLDPDYPKMKIKELKLKNLYGESEELNFEIDYLNEEYLMRCEMKLKPLEEYVEKKITEIGRKIRKTLEKEEVYERVWQRLEKEGKIFNSSTVKVLMKAERELE